MKNILLIMGMLLLSNTEICAQQNEPVIDSVELQMVKVYGKSAAQQMREGTFSVNAIDVKSLVNTTNNLNSILNRSTGVRIREEGGVGSDYDLSINGMSGNSIRYFIDGVPMSVMGSGVALNNLPINLVDRIDIYKGVIPASLGGDALGGAVNIVTKKSLKNYFDASYGIGSFHTHKADLSGKYNIGKSGVFVKPSLGVNYSKNDYKVRGVEMWDEESRKYRPKTFKRFHDDYFSLFAELELGVARKNWTDLFAVKVSYSKVDKDIQTGSTQSLVYGKAERESDAWSVSALYSKRGLFVDNLAFRASLSQTWDHSLTIDTTFRKYNWSGSFIETSRNEITGRDKSMRHYKRPLTVATGTLAYDIDPFNSLEVNYSMNRTGNRRYDTYDESFEESKDVLAKHILGFTYRNSYFANRWNNDVFVKNYTNHLEIEQQDLYWITGATEAPNRATDNYWGYGVASRFVVIEPLAVKLSYEHSVRLPLSRELLGNGVTVYPNLLLQPENSNNINAGMYGSWSSGNKSSFYYELGGFYRDVKDYIHAVVSETEGTMQYENVSSVNVRGLEAEVRYEYGNFLQAVVNCSYQNARSMTKYKEDGKVAVTYKNKIPNTPWLYSNADLYLTKSNLFGKGGNLKFGYHYSYVHWFFLTWEGYGSLDSKSKIPTQNVHAADLTYSWARDRYNVSFMCENLTNKATYDNFKLQKPGRSFFVKLRIFIN